MQNGFCHRHYADKIAYFFIAFAPSNTSHRCV